MRSEKIVFGQSDFHDLSEIFTPDKKPLFLWRNRVIAVFAHRVRLLKHLGLGDHGAKGHITQIVFMGDTLHGQSHALKVLFRIQTMGHYR